MEKHGNVTIDFKNFGGPRIDMRVPFHLNARSLINELASIYGYGELQVDLQLQSFKTVISEQFISGKETLIDAGVRDGEILIIIK